MTTAFSFQLGQERTLPLLDPGGKKWTQTQKVINASAYEADLSKSLFHFPFKNPCDPNVHKPSYIKID